MALSTGQVLNNRYRIVKLLGQGGYGAVFRAWDMNLGAPCALKQNLSEAPEVLDQFKREALMLSQLHHPNLPRVFDHFNIPGMGHYLVMEYVDGEDLQAKLDQAGGPLPESEVMPWIRQVCEALAYLHSQNPPIIHRDIKPANIRITSQGQAILVDFGIAKVFDQHKHTALGARAVTPGYSPNEQYGIGARTDARTDIYALGATLYTLLTGQVPVDTPERNMGAPLIPPREFNPAISVSADKAIQRAMEMRPDDRFPSIAEFTAAFEEAQYEPQYIEQVAPSPDYSQQAPPPTVQRRFPWGWIVLVGILLLAVCGLLGMFLYRSTTESKYVSTLTALAQGALPTNTTAINTNPTTPPPASTTPAATSTALPLATPTPADTPTAIPATPLAATPITVSEWALSHFTTTTSGECSEQASACWVVNSVDAAKMKSQEFYVDSSWKNPYLVWNQNYRFERKAYRGFFGSYNSFGYVRLLYESKIFTLIQYTNTSSGGAWKVGSWSLDQFKGKNIIIEFATEKMRTAAGQGPSYFWYILDVQIVPDYQPQ